MENTNTIELTGSNEVVSIIGFDKYEILGIKVVEALNENFILEDLVCDGVVEVENLSNSNEYYLIGGQEYLAIEGEESANKRAIEYTKEVFSDCGLSENLIEIADQQGFIDEDWFEDFWKELHEYQAWNEGIEYIATEEELEQLEKGEITEDEIREGYEESLNSSIGDNWMEEYKFQFGGEDFERVLKDENLIDFDKLAEYCLEVDGRGHSLAHYDGEEIEENDLFLYRVN